MLLGGHAFAATTIQNVLFIVSDDLRASVLGCYGDKICARPPHFPTPVPVLTVPGASGAKANS